MIDSVRHRRTFSELRSKGRRVRHGSVRMTYLDSNSLRGTDLDSGSGRETAVEVAYALGRAFGNAVERNRARRRLRDAFKAAITSPGLDEAFSSGGAFLLSGHRRLLSAPFSQLVADIESCLKSLDQGVLDHDSRKASKKV